MTNEEIRKTKNRKWEYHGVSKYYICIRFCSYLTFAIYYGLHNNLNSSYHFEYDKIYFNQTMIMQSFIARPRLSSRGRSEYCTRLRVFLWVLWRPRRLINNFNEQKKFKLDPRITKIVKWNQQNQQLKGLYISRFFPSRSNIVWVLLDFVRNHWGV